MESNLKPSMMEDLKITLRAILISAGCSLTLQQLLSDFRNSAGYELPYRKLGYPTADALITNIPDTVFLSRGRRGELLCGSVSDSSTGHVVKLVREQNSKGKTSSLMGSAPSQRNSRPRPTYMHDSGSRRYQNFPSRPNYARQSQFSPPVQNRTIPPVTMGQIKHVVDMYSSGLDTNQFNTAFLARYGTEFNPNQYGFHSLEELAKTMKDHIVIRRKGDCWLLYPLEERSSVSEQVVIEQKSHRKLYEPPHRRFDSPPQKYDTPLQKFDPPSQKFDDFSQQKDDHAPQKYETSKVEEPKSPQPVSNTVCIQTSLGLDRNSSFTSNEQHQYFKHQLLESSDKDYCPNPLEHEPTTENSWSSYLSKDMHSTFIELLETYPQGIWANELPLKYKAFRKKELNFHKLGFFSIIELACAVPEIFTVYRPKPNSDWLLKDARFDANHEPEIPISSSKPVEAPVKLPTALNERASAESKMDALRQVYDVLKSQPKGIHINEFNTVYKAYTGRDLPLARLGCRDTDGFLSVIADIVHAHFADEGIIVTANAAGEEYLNSTKQESPMYMEPVCINPEIPTDAELFTSGFTRLPIDQYFKPKQFVKLKVSHVHTPTNFYVQLISSETTDKLEWLMRQLDVFYNSVEGSQYSMLNQDVMIGHVCVAVYPGVNSGDRSWHRATITKTWSRYQYQDPVEVLFVDYGSKNNISRDHLRYIKKDFLVLPAQAIPTTLGFMRSSSEDGVWSQNANQYFFDMVDDKPLVGYVWDIEGDRLVLEYLTDTSKEEDFHIMDAMSAGGYACLNLQPVVSDGHYEAKRVTPLPSPTALPIPQPTPLPFLLPTAAPCVFPDPQLAQAYQQYLQLSSYFNPMLIPAVLGNNYQIPQLGLMAPAPHINLDLQKLLQEATAAASNSLHQSFTPLFDSTPSNQVLGAPAPANPVFAAPAPANPMFAAPAPANPMFATPVPANPMFASPAPANPVYTSPERPNLSASCMTSVNPVQGAISITPVPVSSTAVVGATSSALIQNSSSLDVLSSGDTSYNIAGTTCLASNMNEAGDPSNINDNKFKLDSTWKQISSPECKISRVKPMTKQVDENDWERLFSQLTMEGRKRYIKIIDLTNTHRVFLVNKDGQPYLLSADVSKFIWTLDVIKRMLRLHGMNVPSLTVTDQEDLGLFLELDRYNIPTNKAEAELSVTLYPLESVPTILKGLNSRDVELMEAVEKEIVNFNPRDVYWKTPAEEDPRMPAEGHS